jgi:hypothetical protein
LAEAVSPACEKGTPSNDVKRPLHLVQYYN